MIAYHKASFKIASGLAVFYKGTLRQYGTYMTEYRLKCKHQWVNSIFSVKVGLNQGSILSPFIL